MGGRVEQGSLQKIRDGVITEGPVFLKVNSIFMLCSSASCRIKVIHYIAGLSAAASRQKAQGCVFRWLKQHGGSLCLNSMSLDRVRPAQRRLHREACVLHLQPHQRVT